MERLNGMGSNLATKETVTALLGAAALLAAAYGVVQAI